MSRTIGARHFGVRGAEEGQDPCAGSGREVHGSRVTGHEECAAPLEGRQLVEVRLAHEAFDPMLGSSHGHGADAGGSVFGSAHQEDRGRVRLTKLAGELAEAIRAPAILGLRGPEVDQDGGRIE